MLNKLVITPKIKV